MKFKETRSKVNEKITFQYVNVHLLQSYKVVHMPIAGQYSNKMKIADLIRKLFT